MLRVLRILTFVISSLFVGGPAFANCTLIARLDGILAIEQRIARATFEPDLGNAIQYLARESALINSSNLSDAVGPSRFEAFDLFVANTKTFLQLAGRDAATAQAFLQTTAAAENLAAIHALMPELRCIPASDAQTSPTNDKSGASLSGVPLNFTLSMAKVAAVIASIIGGGLGAFGVYRWRTLQQRRAKRHHIHYPTTYRAAGATYDGVLLDVSGAGVKLRHDPDHPMTTGSQVTVQILDQWIGGTIQWSNSNYSGILFKSAMRGRQVQKLVHAPKHLLERKTAPQGDAV